MGGGWASPFSVPAGLSFATRWAHNAANQTPTHLTSRVPPLCAGGRGVGQRGGGYTCPVLSKSARVRLAFAVATRRLADKHANVRTSIGNAFCKRVRWTENGGEGSAKGELSTSNASVVGGGGGWVGWGRTGSGGGGGMERGGGRLDFVWRGRGASGWGGCGQLALPSLHGKGWTSSVPFGHSCC